MARTVVDLMSAPPVVAPAGTPITEAARLMDREGVKRLPVVDDADRLVGIVSRGDLLKVHLRSDEAIRSDIESGVLRSFLIDDAAAVMVAVVDGMVTLAGRVDRWSSAEIAERLSRRVQGVVEVTSSLSYRFDDREIGVRLGSGVA